MKKFRLHTKPWKHQYEALNYLFKRKFGALYTDMGSGKTKIIIDLIANKKYTHVLIACPNRICDTWEEEFKKHAPYEDILVVNLKGVPDKGKTNLIIERMKESKFSTLVMICNYESIWRDNFKQYLYDVEPQCIICDESHRIKGAGSKVSGTLSRMGKKAEQRFLVTGTPMAQNPLDVYAQYRFLAPEIFGTNFNNYKSRYANYEMHVGGFPTLNKKEPFKNLDELHDKMFSCAFYIEDLDQNLPPTTTIDVTFEFGQGAVYRKLNKDGCLEIKSGDVATNNILSKITALQQLLSGHLRVEDEQGIKSLEKVDDSRREAFKELLESIPYNEPVVAFCRFKKDLENIKIVSKQVNRRHYELSGKEDTKKEWVDDSSGAVIGIQIAAGAEGINDLIKSRYCIYYSHDPSLARWKQSRKRQHRPGQTRPVIYYKLIAKVGKLETIDQKIYRGIELNQSVVDIVMKEQKI